MISDSSQLNIGPIRFILHSDGSEPPRYEGMAHEAFLAPASEPVAPTPLAELAVRIKRGHGACPSAPALFTVGANWSIWSVGDEWHICTGCANPERPRAVCRVERTLRQATLHVDGDPCDAPLRYPLDQVLSYGLLGKCGGILLHAAAVVREGAAMVFAGRSGAGKSTLSGLCAEAGWRVLNDDRVMLYPDPAGGGWLVAGTPWHGSGRFARNETAPLQGVFLLVQDTENRVEPLQADEARRSLLPVASVAWFLDEWAQAGLDALDRITREVPVRRFCFTRSPEAVEVLALESVA